MVSASSFFSSLFISCFSCFSSPPLFVFSFMLTRRPAPTRRHRCGQRCTSRGSCPRAPCRQQSPTRGSTAWPSSARCPRRRKRFAPASSARQPGAQTTTPMDHTAGSAVSQGGPECVIADRFWGFARRTNLDPRGVQQQEGPRPARLYYRFATADFRLRFPPAVANRLLLKCSYRSDSVMIDRRRLRVHD